MNFYHSELKINDIEKESMLNKLPFEVLEKIISYFDFKSIIAYDLIDYLLSIYLTKFIVFQKHVIFGEIIYINSLKSMTIKKFRL